jgi:polar amino acid transport system substrate-binding protein
MIRQVVGLLLAVCGMSYAYAAGPDIVFIAATNHTMPLSHFEDGRLTGGIIKDLGDSIAKRLGRRAVYVSAPPKRVPIILANGEADSVCYVMPHWIEGEFNWSKPLIPSSGVLVARTDAPVVKSLSELADKRVGTVLGYRYPNFDEALGKHFSREDAPAMASNMNKLQAGRMQYAIMEKMTILYLMRSVEQTHVRVDLEFSPIKAHCAFSHKSNIKFAEANRAINSLVDDGSVERILALYR